MSSDGRLEYEQRVNRVIDHVREHLAEPLPLAELARVAAFSPFHFHRVFRAITGETLFGFIQRQRIEKAAGALLTARQSRASSRWPSITGSRSAATFARAFRAHFGMSATQWRAGGAARWRARHAPRRKPGKQLRKPRKARRPGRADTPRSHRKEGTMSIQVKDLPDYHVAYMRYVGPYGPHGIPAAVGPADRLDGAARPLHAAPDPARHRLRRSVDHRGRPVSLRRVRRRPA